MELPTVNGLLSQTLRTLSRFPLVLGAALMGTACALWLNHIPDADNAGRDLAGNLAMTAWLGVGLLFSLATLAETRHWRWPLALGAQAVGLMALAFYFHSLAGSHFPIRMARFWLFMLAVHMFAAAIPALGREADGSGFWLANQRLAARLMLSLAYAGLLFLGLEVALACVKSLFELAVPDRFFLDPGIIALGIFNSIFFLAGVPRPALPSRAQACQAPAHAPIHRPYPRRLRILSLFILPSLVYIYLLILYAYAVKVLAAWKWPTGWVTYLLLSLCAMGMSALVLIHPLSEQEGNRWAKDFCRRFQFAMFPLLILLFVAIGKRILDYGITENRYFVLAAGIWMAGITFQLALDPRRDLRILPASLCLVALLSSCGPWGAFEVSRRSQTERLRGLLEGHGMLVGGKLAKAPARIPREVNRQIGSIATYLEERGRLGDLQSWIPAMEDFGEANAAAWPSVAWQKTLASRFSFMEALELPFLPDAPTGPGHAESVAFSCRACSGPVRKVAGFDFLYADYHPSQPEDSAIASPLPEGCRIAFEPALGVLRVFAQDTLGPSIDVGGFFQRLQERYPDASDLNLPEDEMILESEDKVMRIQVRLRRVNGPLTHETASIGDFSADIFVKVKIHSRLRAPDAHRAGLARMDALRHRGAGSIFERESVSPTASP